MCPYAVRCLALVAAIGLCACAQQPPVPTETNVEAFKGNLRGAGIMPFDGRATVLAASASPHHDIAGMFENGYGLIERLTYTGTDDPVNTATAHAKTIGASHVILNSQHNTTRKEVNPNLFVSPLLAVMFPELVVYRNNDVLYFAPLERKGLGVYVVDLTEETRRWLGDSGLTNGVAVAAVRPGSPARAAGIKAGDIIVTVDGKEILDRQGFAGALSQITGDHTFQIVRGGETLEKSASVPAAW